MNKVLNTTFKLYLGPFHFGITLKSKLLIYWAIYCLYATKYIHTLMSYKKISIKGKQNKTKLLV